MRQVSRTLKVSVLLVFSTFLISCSVQLAPLYDKAIIDGMTTANKEIMTLFASVSAGTTAGSFQSRAESYNKAIGSIDALEIQTKARPAPKSGIIDAVNKRLEKSGIQSLADGEAPSATALQKISITLTKMRDTDRKQGLSPLEIQTFKNQTSIYMDQAITYESFLQR